MQLGAYADSFRSYCMAFGGGFSACASAGMLSTPAHEMQPRSHEDTKNAPEEYGFLRGFVSSWQKMQQPPKMLRFVAPRPVADRPLPREQLRDRSAGVRMLLPVVDAQRLCEGGRYLVLIDRGAVPPLAAARPVGTRERHPD